MNDRIGFLSFAGLLAAAVAVVGIVGLAVLTGPAMFSPGPLSAQSKGQTLGGVTSHVQLAGRCEACHNAPWSTRTMADRCLTCHTDVGTQIGAKSGLHGILVGKLSSLTCRGCHSDHRGAGATLTLANPADFPHDLTGYTLRGHQRKSDGSGFACADCHVKTLASFDVATCADCHTTINAGFMSQHEKDFGNQCLQCHIGNDPFGANFTHTMFPLNHGSNEQKATCKTCHPDNGFKTYTCFGCHRHTPASVQAGHEGQSAALLTNCIRCHPQGKQGD